MKMELSKKQLTEIVKITMLTQEEQALNIDCQVYAQISDQLDNLVNSIVNQGKKIFTHVDFKGPFKDYIYSNYLIEQSLVKRKFSEGDIIKSISITQTYIFLKLTKLSEYFKEIEYYEGCANINYVKKVFSNFGKSKEFKKIIADLE